MYDYSTVFSRSTKMQRGYVRTSCVRRIGLDELNYCTSTVRTVPERRVLTWYDVCMTFVGVRVVPMSKEREAALASNRKSTYMTRSWRRERKCCFTNGTSLYDHYKTLQDKRNVEPH